MKNKQISNKGILEYLKVLKNGLQTKILRTGDLLPIVYCGQILI